MAIFVDEQVEQQAIELASRHPLKPSKTKYVNSILRSVFTLPEDQINALLAPASPAPQPVSKEDE